MLDTQTRELAERLTASAVLCDRLATSTGEDYAAGAASAYRSAAAAVRELGGAR